MTQLSEFRPGLWLTELQLEEFAVRGALILGRDRALIWDTLSHPRDMQPLYPLIGDKPLTIVYSHADWDHVWGTAGLPYANTPIIAHSECLRRFTTDVPLTLQAQQHAAPHLWAEVRLIPPTQTFETTLTLDLGDITVQLHHLPGHTADCMVAFIPEWGILLAGDTVETPLPLLESGPLAGWITQLQHWYAHPQLQQIIPAHGQWGDKTLLQANIHYLQALATGTPPLISTELDAFYHQAHQANLQTSEIMRTPQG